MKIYLGKSRFSRIVSRIVFKIIQRVYRLLKPQKHQHKDKRGQGSQYYGYVQYYNEYANKKVDEFLSTKGPCLVSKFGTIELSHLLQQRLSEMQCYSLQAIKEFIKDEIPNLNWNTGVKSLCFNAGFFPNDATLLKKFYEENLEAVRQIDILGSYIVNEKYFDEELKGAIRVNLDGYYAPFFYDEPWTRRLKGKKVLVVHPFSEEIRTQYQERRRLIWKNPDVLPDFELITYKAIQSMMGIKTEYETWFDALNKMKDDISKINFDIALVGCGAYGMPLAAHCKKMGKKAIHLAGWTQILFGIIGTRWENNPQVSPFINEYWIHPSASNRPQNAEKIENACYW